MSSFFACPGEDLGIHRRRRNLLHQYYGLGSEGQTAASSPTDINGMHFDVDAYMDKLLREKRMTELLRLQSTFNDGESRCACALCSRIKPSPLSGNDDGGEGLMDGVVVEIHSLCRALLSLA